MEEINIKEFFVYLKKYIFAFIGIIDMAIWNKSKPPFNLFIDHRILNCYCVAYSAYTSD